MNYKLWFNNLKFSQKLQLYIIPILFFVVYYINFNSSNINKTISKQAITKYDSKINIIKKFNKLFKKYKITFDKFDFNNNILFISCNSNFKNIVNFLNKSSSIYKIISYELYKKDKKFILEITYNTHITNITNITKINDNYKLKNPFGVIKSKRKTNSKAIIGNFVFIGTKWYKLHDTYKNNEIIKINKNSVVLQNKSKIYTMEVFDDK